MSSRVSHKLWRARFVVARHRTRIAKDEPGRETPE
jgi:hypothetical protein